MLILNHKSKEGIRKLKQKFKNQTRLSLNSRKVRKKQIEVLKNRKKPKTKVKQ